jgi:hypothetical protein
MRTEDDLRAAFMALERHAPDAARVLPGARRGRRGLSSERRPGSPPRNRFRRLRPAWRLAIAVPLALGLAAGVTVAVLPSGQPALTVQLLADRAAAAALASPAVPAGQWVYEVRRIPAPGRTRLVCPTPLRRRAG